MCKIANIFVILAVLSGASFAADKSTSEAISSYPMELAGIKLNSNDYEVVKRHGRGLYVALEGHTGGVYYVDNERKFTLHVTLGVGYIVDSICVSKGLNLPKDYDSKKQPLYLLTSWEIKDSTISSFGKTPDEIIKRFGKPNEDSKSGSKRILKFTSDYNDTRSVAPQCELFYELTFKFENDIITEASIYCGE